VPLNNTDALRSWGERDNPPYREWAAVERWVLDLDHSPWQPPSTPWSVNEGEPVEIRCAELSDSSVVIFYTVDQESLRVDLLYVGP